MKIRIEIETRLQYIYREIECQIELVYRLSTVETNIHICQSHKNIMYQ